MAGISKKTPLPCWQFVMDVAGWENVAEMARMTGLPDGTCRSYVFRGDIPSIANLVLIASKSGIGFEELVTSIYMDKARELTDKARELIAS